MVAPVRRADAEDDLHERAEGVGEEAHFTAPEPGFGVGAVRGGVVVGEDLVPVDMPHVTLDPGRFLRGSVLLDGVPERAARADGRFLAAALRLHPRPREARLQEVEHCLVPVGDQGHHLVDVVDAEAAEQHRRRDTMLYEGEVDEKGGPVRMLPGRYADGTGRAVLVGVAGSHLQVETVLGLPHARHVSAEPLLHEHDPVLPVHDEMPRALEARIARETAACEEVHVRPHHHGLLEELYAGHYAGLALDPTHAVDIADVRVDGRRIVTPHQAAIAGRNPRAVAARRARDHVFDLNGVDLVVFPIRPW